MERITKTKGDATKMSLEKDELDFWLFPELFVRITAFVTISVILANYWAGKLIGKIILPILFIAFLLWTFRPFLIAIKNFKLPPKKKNVDYKQILNTIFWIVTIIGFVLFINRAIIPILPNAEWRVLSDHIFGGFLITVWFYILILGMFSFFQPNRKIDYRKRWFLLASGVTILGVIVWEGLIQKFANVSQIVADIFGLTLSWVYFVFFRKFNKPKNTQNQLNEKEKNKK